MVYERDGIEGVADGGIASYSLASIVAEYAAL